MGDAIVLLVDQGGIDGCGAGNSQQLTENRLTAVAGCERVTWSDLVFVASVGNGGIIVGRCLPIWLG